MCPCFSAGKHETSHDFTAYCVQQSIAHSAEFSRRPQILRETCGVPAAFFVFVVFDVVFIGFVFKSHPLIQRVERNASRKAEV